MENSVESDVFIGSNKGIVSRYTSDKHIFLLRNAREWTINCIKVTDINQHSTLVITWGEDGIIKIWNPSITLVKQVYVKKINPLLDLHNPKAYGVQFIDA